MTIKKIFFIMLMGFGFAFTQTPDWRPRTFFRIRVLNEDDIKEIFPGDIITMKIEIEARPTATIEKVVYASSTGMELVPPFPSYGMKTVQAGEVMFMELRVRATIRGSQSCWLQIYSHDDKGNPDPGVSSSGGLSIYNRKTMSVRSAEAMRDEREGLARYNAKPQWTEDDLALAEKEEKVLKGPPIRIELPFVKGSCPTMTKHEIGTLRGDLQRRQEGDFSDKNIPQWYKDWIKRQ